ncbi:MAG: APC family permease [Halobacteriota archaeon]
MSEAGSEASGRGLRPDVSLLGAVSIEVGLIVGAGLFSLTGVAAGIAGTALPLSYFLAFTVVALSIVPTAVLGSAFPTTGGNYRYPSRLWSPRAAFVATWALALSMFTGGLPLYALSFGEYVADLVAVEPVVVGFVVLTAFYLANLFGIRVATGVQFLLFLTLVASLVLFVAGGLPAVDPGRFDPLLSNGVVGLATGAAILYFVCLGANFIVDLGDEVAQAATTIPRSFAVSIPLVMTLYVLTGLVAIGTVGWEAMAGETLSLPARAVLPEALATVFIVGGALFAIATTINAVFMIAPKYLLVLAEDGFFPAAVARVNDRFGTPHWGLTAVYGLSVAALLSPLPLGQLGALLGFGGILLVIPVMVAAIKFPKRHPEAYAAASFSVGRRPLAAFAVGAIVCNVVLLGLLASQELLVFAGWAVGVVVGDAYYHLRKRYLAERGIDPVAQMEGLDAHG